MQTITVTMDQFDLYYYVEGLSKYSDFDVWSFLIDIQEQIPKNMQTFLRYYAKRDLGYMYGAFPMTDNRKPSFDSFLEVFGNPCGERSGGVTLDLTLPQLKCYIQSKGHGSHLRQDIWQFLVDDIYDRIGERERKDLFEWAKGEFDITDYRKEDFETFMDRYDPSRQYEVQYEYRLGGKKGTDSEKVFLHQDEWCVSFTKRLIDWRKGNDYVEIINTKKL